MKAGLHPSASAEKSEPVLKAQELRRKKEEGTKLGRQARRRAERKYRQLLKASFSFQDIPREP